jgi:protein TonB
MHPPRLPAKGNGKIYLSFIITKVGDVTNVEILKDNVGFGYGEEAARVLQSMPKWIPGLNNDRPVNVKMMIPISFETED